MAVKIGANAITFFTRLPLCNSHSPSSSLHNTLPPSSIFFFSFQNRLFFSSMATHVVFAPFLRVRRLSDNAILPSRASPLSAGYDLSSAVETKIPARGKALVATDLSIAIPEGTYARIAPRSGLALKHSIDVGAGVIDADYRGPIGVILFNHSDSDFEVKVGDRIAQMIIEKIVTPEVQEVGVLDVVPARGEGGFGSTGV